MASHAEGAPGGSGTSGAAVAAADLTPAATEAPPRGWLRVAVDPVFGRYLLGNVLTMLGIWIFNIVAVVVAYEATGSALVAGTVTAGQFVPHLLLSVPAGAAADRWDRRVQAATGHGVAALGAGGLALWTWHHDLGPDAAVPLVAGSVVVGVGTAVAGPAMLSLVPAMVRPGELPTAVALGMAPLPLGRALGPVIGTTLAVVADPAVAFAVTAGCSTAFVVLLAGLHPRSAPRAPHQGQRAGAWAYLTARRPLLVLLGCVAAVGAGTDPPITLAPAVSAALTGGTGLAGPIATAFGVGAGLGFALIPAARRALGVHRYGYAGLLVMAAGSAVALVPTIPSTLVGFALSGAGLTLTMTGLSATLQTTLPEEVRGRVMAVWAVAFVGTRPLAALSNGLLADELSPAAALAGMVLLGVVAGCVGLARGAGARRE